MYLASKAFCLSWVKLYDRTLSCHRFRQICACECACICIHTYVPACAQACVLRTWYIFHAIIHWCAFLSLEMHKMRISARKHVFCMYAHASLHSEYLHMSAGRTAITLNFNAVYSKCVFRYYHISSMLMCVHRFMYTYIHTRTRTCLCVECTYVYICMYLHKHT
jgi:hypothetical protein